MTPFVMSLGMSLVAGSQTKGIAHGSSCQQAFKGVWDWRPSRLLAPKRDVSRACSSPHERSHPDAVSESSRRNFAQFMDALALQQALKLKMGNALS